jgi:hypothetical protein
MLMSALSLLTLGANHALARWFAAAVRTFVKLNTEKQ